jgi:uncharacterized protein
MVDHLDSPSASQLPRPVITELSAPYWKALEDGYLVFQRCSCGHAWLPARRNCTSCLGADNEWVRASGRGRLVSWVVYHHVYHEAFASRIPYNVAIVALDEGPQLITNMLDEHALLRGDAPVALEIQHDGEQVLARFRMCSSETT